MFYKTCRGEHYTQIKYSRMWRKGLIFVVGWSLVAPGARADIASADFVRQNIEDSRIQADWNQADSSLPDYIKNKPDVPSPDAVEYIANKVSEVNTSATDTQYPSARAVQNALDTKANADDVRFNTIATVQPSGTPPAGQVFIWFN